jgi:hypothetical protein
MVQQRSSVVTRTGFETYQEQEQYFSDLFVQQMSKPATLSDELLRECHFEPWNIFPCVFGTYSAAFDNVALEVLCEMRAKSIYGLWDGIHYDTIAHDMFREILCAQNFCTYGTSPRYCFPQPGHVFSERLIELIEKWEAYRIVVWDLTPEDIQDLEQERLAATERFVKHQLPKSSEFQQSAIRQLTEQIEEDLLRGSDLTPET